jgi:hypothetical protein
MLSSFTNIFAENILRILRHNFCTEQQISVISVKPLKESIVNCAKTVLQCTNNVDEINLRGLYYKTLRTLNSNIDN